MTAACDDERHATERFCPTCGAWDGTEGDGGSALRRRRWRLGAIGVGCLVVVTMAMGPWSSSGSRPATERPRETDAGNVAAPGEVALPDRAGQRGDGSEAASDPSTATAADQRDRGHVRDTGAERVGIATCVPRGCVQWERHVDGLLTADRAAVHVVDERQVRSYDATDGTLRWRRSLLDPLPAGAAPDGFATHPAPVAIDARDDTVVTASARRIVALDADGRWRWTVAPRDDGATELVRLAADGHVVTATRAPEGRRAPVRVAVLDAATGDERWSQRITAVVAVDDAVITVLDADEVLTGIDVTDGRLRWRRASSRDPSGWPPLIDTPDPAGTDPAAGTDGGRAAGDDADDDEPGDADDADDDELGGADDGAAPDATPDATPDAAPDADTGRRRSARADLASYDALIVGFPGGSATIRGPGPQVVLEDPTVVVVGERLLGIGHVG